ncbi:MAG: alpha/beta hydrolase, partial [Deltaproteobacteria bacterium]|nr:alpha/beta hydrolase [Deltaproteobacteria bacterium]
LGFAAGAVDRLGVRLIAVDRPGLGRSDPAPGRTLLDFATDIRALSSELSLERPAIIGFSQGSPFALVCAAGGAVSAAAIVSGTDELARVRDVLPPPARHGIELAEADPPAAEAMFRQMLSPAGLKEMLRVASPQVDLAVYLEPAFAAAFAAAVDEAFAQGPDGYARDALLAMQRWPFDPAAIRVPVQLWYGSADASPFHSPDHGDSLARRIPDAKRTVIEGGGGSILWTHGPQILEALLEARGR